MYIYMPFCMVSRILFLQTVIKPSVPAARAQSHNHQTTREFPTLYDLKT